MGNLAFHLTNLAAILGLSLMWYSIYKLSQVTKKGKMRVLLDYSLVFLMLMPMSVLVAMYIFPAVSELAILLFSVSYVIGGIFAHLGAHDLKHVLKLKEDPILKKIVYGYLTLFLMVGLFFVLKMHPSLERIGTGMLLIGEVDIAISFYVIALLLGKKSKLFILPLIAAFILPLDSILSGYGHTYLIPAISQADAVAKLHLIRAVGALIYLTVGSLLAISINSYQK